MKEKRVTLDWLVVAGALAINILWYFVPLAGETGFMALWEVEPLFAVPSSLVLTGFFVGRLIMSIKKW